MYFEPDIMRFADGSAVKNAADWQKRRGELLQILYEQEYGYPQPAPACVKGTVEGVVEDGEGHCAGRIDIERVRIAFDTPKGEFSFPLHVYKHRDGQKRPLILMINFRPDLYDRYLPVEEIIDNGFALAMVYYEDITTDDGDMQNGLSGCYPRNDPATDWGKISMWAWGMSRCLDYLLTREDVDGENVAVAGHSRLGKTVLLCGAMDERVKFVCENDSGCGGSALERTKNPEAETIASMNVRFPYWFCGNRAQYAGHEQEMPFDQHFLMAAIAPRFVATGSAVEDLWADPPSQQLCCAAASPAWQVCGLKGYVGPETPAAPGDRFNDGEVGYHLRAGAHFFSRTDWLSYMAFIKKHMA